MDIKKLYGEVAAFCGEMPLYAFLAYIDCFARYVINRYGKAYTVVNGEYTKPLTLDDAFSVDASYRGALFYFVLGEYTGDEKLLKRSYEYASDAAKALRKANFGVRKIINEVW